MKKYLTDRKEVAKAMNFGKYPVLHIDLETPKAGWDDNFVGDKVLVAMPGDTERSAFIRCEIHKFGDQPYVYSLMPECICIDDSFGYYDVMEMLAWAQAPVIRPGEEVIIIEDWPKAGRCCVHKMRVTNASEWVYPTCYLEEIEEG